MPTQNKPAEEAKSLFFAALDDLDAGNNADAERRLREALVLAPGRVSVLSNLAVALSRQGKVAEALTATEEALAVDADDAETWVLAGLTLAALDRPDEALAAYDRVLTIEPDHADALTARGLLALAEQRYDEAADSLARAQTLQPRANTLGALVHARMSLAQWATIEADWAEMIVTVDKGDAEPANPFFLLSMPTTAEQQLNAARQYCDRYFPPVEPPLWSGETYTHTRLRIAFISPDYRKHATALLTAGMFEHFNRRIVETIAISTGPNEDSDMRRRLMQAFERFIDVRQQSDEQVARMLHEMRVDVVVDLAGHTKYSRPGILARRPAPVQVSYLGYPGTTGAAYYDFVIADTTVIPPEAHKFYSEAVMTLPNSYQANDSSRHQARLTGSRAAHGLPEEGVVFCAFCNTYKITPAAFDIWMRLLREVEGSVLWLLDGGATAAANLKREAEARGVPSDRLVFAPRTRMEEHTDRHRHADLFLDTLIYNGHTTVSDALWSGLPVVTCSGGTFASRVAASLLKAAHVPELITDSRADYESLALELARDPVRLSGLKRKVVANRPLCPLFKTQVFAKQFQAGLVLMAERARRGEKPEGFAVESMDAGGR